uniref:Uncharacterized protein n=1 Tax=Arundo donax TaxID=35708 RepID=A0A0A9APJ2_ARUDO
MESTSTSAVATYITRSPISSSQIDRY